MNSWRILAGLCLLLLLTGLPLTLNGQNTSRTAFPVVASDSLNSHERNLLEVARAAFTKEKSDTGKARVIVRLISSSGAEYAKVSYSSWLEGFVKEKSASAEPEIAHRLKDALAEALDQTGVWYFQQGNMEEAMVFYSKSIGLSENSGNPNLKATTYNNIGMVHLQQGNIPMSLEYFRKSLQLFENGGNKADMVLPLDNIGYVHEKLGDLDLALEYYTQSLRINLLAADSEMISYSYNNIGHVYEYQGKQDQALDHYLRALELNESTGDSSGMSYSYKNIAAIYSRIDSVDKALEYYYKSLQARKGLDDLAGMAYTYVRIGFLHLREGRIREARKIGTEGLALAQRIGFPDAIAQNANLLSKTAIRAEDYKTALEMRNLEIRMKDSLANEENIRAAAQQQSRYEFEKQQAIRDAEYEYAIERQRAVSEAEKSRQKTIITAVSSGLILSALFAFFLITRIRIIRNQKSIIETQKDEVQSQKELVELRNKEVMVSINYAKRIQEAILPSIPSIRRELKDCFVLYRPKDVVAGDFYWMEKHGSLVYFAAADCTGHGVPGAMVSVICSHALSKALLEENASNPSELLDLTVPS